MARVVKINMLFERTSLRMTGMAKGRAVAMRPDLQKTAEKIAVVTVVPRPQSTRNVFLVKKLRQ